MSNKKAITTINTLKKALPVFVLAAVLAVMTACGSQAPAAETGKQPVSKKISKFMKEPFGDSKVTNEDEAYEALMGIINELGGDENTELAYQDVVYNDEGTVFYSFAQTVGSIQVEFGNVKLVADKDSHPLAVISTLIAGIQPTPENAWEITKEEAEAIVEQQADTGDKVIPEATEQTLLWDDEANSLVYVWVVYCNNNSPEIKKNYIASYVSGIGKYLYSVPVTEPGNTEALSGAVSAFAFDGYSSGEWTGTVKDIDGPERTITVPVMVDEETGNVVLADRERKILCADCTDFVTNNTLTPVVSKDDSWVNNEVITYEMFIRVWDFYDSIGWHGPDGDGTPTLILMNLCDSNGEPIDNASYAGNSKGFQVFKVNDKYGDGSCSDIIGHEFTHCVTSSAMIDQIYENEYGAMNEAMSDIMGNLIETYFGDSPNGAWLFSDRHSNGTIRDMKDPHRFNQPEYVWDSFYVPYTAYPTDNNDYGGVHRNSSLMNVISYKLDQAGMSTEEQIYFWMNVALTMTPATDLAQMSEILPWCMEMAGYPQYMDALDKAISEGDFARREAPENAENGKGLIRMEIQFDTADTEPDTLLLIAPTDKSFECINTWPDENGCISAILPEGDYYIRIAVYDRTSGIQLAASSLTKDGWINGDVSISEIQDSNDKEMQEYHRFHLNSSDVIELPQLDLAASSSGK